MLVTGGEPTTHPNFSLIWKALWHRAKEIALGTNGTILEEKHISEVLEKYPPDIINISAHLYQPQSLAKKIKFIWNRFGSDIKVYMNFVLLPDNVHLLKQYLESDEIPSDIVIKILYPMPTSGKVWMTLEEYIFTAFKVLKDVDVKRKFGFSNMLAAIVDKELNNRFIGGCDVLKIENLYRVGPMGNVYLCMFLPLLTHVGNIYKDSWDTIRERRKKVVERVWKAGSDCMGCHFVDVCRGGCAAIRHYFGGERCSLVRKALDL